MYKYTFTLLLLLYLSGPHRASAQSGNNQFIPAIEVGIPTGSLDDFNVGFGFLAKALFGVGERAQIGATTGYTFFKLSGSDDAYKQRFSVIPILISYRYKLPVVYVEPQLGYGIYGTTIKTEAGGTETRTSSSDGGFTWALGGGVQVGAVDLGLRFQAGYPGGGARSFFGIHAGYIFSAQRK